MAERSIVLQLQQIASEGSSSITDVLRKALLVASKLKLNDFKSWIDAELQGYKDSSVKLPEYRVVHATIKARNPYRGLIPVQMEDSRTEAMYSRTEVRNAIAELEDMAKNTGGQIVQKLGPEHSAVADTYTPIRFDTYRVIASNQVVGIIEAVRTAILEWSLKLEADGILGDGMHFSEPEKERAKSSGNIRINNFQGVLGDVTAGNFQVGDYGSIHNQLKEGGVSQQDRNELEVLMDEYRQAKDGDQRKSVAQKGLDWVGRNAGTLGALAVAIKGYFGA